MSAVEDSPISIDSAKQCSIQIIKMKQIVENGRNDCVKKETPHLNSSTDSEEVEDKSELSMENMDQETIETDRIENVTRSNESEKLFEQITNEIFEEICDKNSEEIPPLVANNAGSSSNFDYSDDEDDDISENSAHNSILSGTNSTISRPEGITDLAWRRMHCHFLLEKMLDLDNATVTDKMIEFFLQEGVCEALVSFITQIPEELEGQDCKFEPSHEKENDIFKRPEPGGDVSIELKRSYKATMLLSNDHPVDIMLSYFAKKARAITNAIFKVFWRQAKGSLHHACRVIDHLLKHQADQVLDVIGASKESLDRFIKPMLRFAAYPPVCETLIVKMLTYPNSAGFCANEGMSQSIFRDSFAGDLVNGTTYAVPYQTTPQSKWQFYSSLAEWKFLLVLASQVYSDNVSNEHASACADMFWEAVDVLSTDENGKILLQPLGHCPELISGLIKVALDQKRRYSLRTDVARVLLSLFHKASQDQLPCQIVRTVGVQQSTMIPNRLKSVQDKMFSIANSRMRELTEGMLAESHTIWNKNSVEKRPKTKHAKASPNKESKIENAENSTALHPGFSVSHPFTLLRYLLLSLIVEIVSFDSSKIVLLSERFWGTLLLWISEYPHNTLFQNLFFKICTMAIRSDKEQVLRTIFTNCKILNKIIDQLMDSEGILKLPPSGAQALYLQILNVVRLQSDLMPPSSFLKSHITNHERWKFFLPLLRKKSEEQNKVGLGFIVPMSSRPGQSEDIKNFSVSDANYGGIDHGSNFARKLGFDMEIVWPFDDSVQQKKKKKKRKKKKNRSVERGQPRSPSDSATKSQNSDDACEDDESDSDNLNGREEADVSLKKESESQPEPET
mmetsp:Transcript_2823/g.3933  ORF Transcript_2823/g.3933 Transcript_2823/m.3933 type:complete len:848 (+) Transcript_2823:66-2609(+)